METCPEITNSLVGLCKENENFKKEFDALIEIEKSDWVSAKDRLPDLEDSVLVRNEKDPEDMWFAHRTDRKDVVVDKNGFAVGYNKEITHWQKIEV